MPEENRSRKLLASILRFVQQDDLEDLKGAALEQANGYLLAVTLQSGDMAWNVEGAVTANPATWHRTELSAKEIRHLSQSLRDGLSSYLTRGFWEICGDKISRIGFFNVAQKRSRGTVYSGPLETAFLWLAQGLIFENAENIDRCALDSCRKFFVPTKRQEYCSRQCSQLARTGRWRYEHKAQLSDIRHAAYIRLVEKLKGKAVAKKVKRRRPLEKSQ
jgi:hypothetical protein